MRVIEKLQQGQTLSVEIEPPELGKNIRDLEKMLDPLVDLGISFIDITYHREKIVEFVTLNGCAIPVVQRKKPGTAGVAGFIKARYGAKGVEPVPHVICLGFDPHQTEEFLVELSYLGVENVLALRGDKSEEGLQLSPLSPQHASELVQQTVRLRNGIYVGAKEGCPIHFCVGAACYPEKHKESPDWEHELKWLKAKVDAGVDYLVTQLFFDPVVYKTFVDKARAAGITVPIIPGIFPLSSYTQIHKLPKMFDCTIPDDLRKIVEVNKDDAKAIKHLGIEWCTYQCQELKKYGAPGLHFYAMRNSPVKEVVKKLMG